VNKNIGSLNAFIYPAHEQKLNHHLILKSNYFTQPFICFRKETFFVSKHMFLFKRN